MPDERVCTIKGSDPPPDLSKVLAALDFGRVSEAFVKLGEAVGKTITSMSASLENLRQNLRLCPPAPYRPRPAQPCAFCHGLKPATHIVKRVANSNGPAWKKRTCADHARKVVNHQRTLGNTARAYRYRTLGH